jgi:PAS domain S-box-containing protein
MISPDDWGGDRLLGLLDGLDVLVFRAEAVSLRVLAVTPNAVGVLGYPLMEWTASPAFLLSRLHADDRERVISVCKATAGGGGPGTCEHRIVAADGRVLWFRTRLRLAGAGELAGWMLDITEAKRVDAAKEGELTRLRMLLEEKVGQHPDERLLETEERLRTVINNAPIILFAFDTDGIVTLSEGKGLEGIGFRPGELVGRSIYEIYRDHPWLLDATRRSLAGEAMTLVREIEGRWFETRLEPHRDAAGHVTGVIGVSHDNTERRRASIALREKELRLRLLFEQVPVLLWTTDRRLRFTSCSGAGLAELQRNAGEIVGSTLAEVLGDDPAVSQFERAIAGETVTCDREVAGRLYHVHLEPFMDEAGEIIGSVGVAVDVTERRRAQEEREHLLRQEQVARADAEEALRRWAFLAEASTKLAASLGYEATLENLARIALPYLADWCVIDLVERDGRLRRVRVAHIDPGKADLTRALERFSPDPEVPVGVSKVLRTSEPEIRLDVERDMLEAREGEWPAVGTRNPEHLRLIRELGLRSYMSIPLIAHGGVLGAVTFVSMNDGRRYGPTELGLAEDLARRAALAVESAQLYQDAQEAVRAREDFLSIASHELRTPVASLLLAVQSLLRVARRATLDAPPTFVNNALETAERQSRRLARVIDDLLDLSRVTGGRLNLEIEEVDVVAVTGEVIEHCREQLAAAGCPLSLRASGKMIGQWDRFRVEQVVTNLLSNAIKYGAGKPITVTVEGDERMARLLVRDEGIGIPADKREEIFERFGRAVSSRNYGGLGLGLYIVRRILDALGGSIRVESEVGLGSTFIVELPRTSAAGARIAG